jgi:aquaporin Z
MSTSKAPPSSTAGAGAPAKEPVWHLFFAEFVGTALLVAIGCSLVVLDFAPQSPVARLVPSPALRRAITGFLFGSTGMAIALSPVGRESGAHINPVVSLAFWARRKLPLGVVGGYVTGQLLGAVVGALALTLWGGWAPSAGWAATLPGPAGSFAALLGEVGATACLVVGLFVFLGHATLRRFTPALFPPLYAVLVWIEAPFSGTSTNPARSLGPALVGRQWSGWWIDWVGPLAGLALGLAILRLPGLRHFEEEVAKLYHFHLDGHGVFRRGRATPGTRGWARL